MTLVKKKESKIAVNLKIDRQTKEKAQALSKEIGIPLSTLMNTYLRQFVRERTVHLSVGIEPNPATKKLMKQAVKDLKERKNIVGPFSSTKEAINTLNTWK